jgi:quercetin dioxygenase-like cupin family protein
MAMFLRSPDLQLFLTAAEAAIRHGMHVPESGAVTARRIFTALQTSSTGPGRTGSGRQPVCRHLDAALAHARLQRGPVAALADAFAAIEPGLGWGSRPGAEAHGERFLNGHANATIVGPEGLEERRDVWIGVSLMAPHTRYPDHNHPPEEVYVVLSPGEWRQGSGPWWQPGSGGLVYNPSNVVHAMRSAAQPLLAIWFLWTGTDSP